GLVANDDDHFFRAAEGVMVVAPRPGEDDAVHDDDEEEDHAAADDDRGVGAAFEVVDLELSLVVRLDHGDRARLHFHPADAHAARHEHHPDEQNGERTEPGSPGRHAAPRAPKH